MSSDEFWDLTFPEFNARLERHRESEKRWDMRFGAFCATYINSKLKEGAEPYQPGDFFGHERPTEDDGPDFEMTPEESIAKMRGLITKAQADAIKRAG